MDLISREKAQEIIPRVVLGVSDFAECIRDSVNTVFDNCPSAFEGMTNGEVVRAVFPEVVPMENEFNISFHSHDKDDFFNECTLDKVWWNAPYKGVSE